jgi:hypothetical protein
VPNASLMKKQARNERILIVASRILLLSVLLMIGTIPGILADKSPSADPIPASIAVSAAIVIRLIIFMLYLKFIRQNRRNSKNRKGEYLGIGFLLAILGIIYMDGAFAFLSHQNMLIFSILMFGSTTCDLVASMMIIILFFLKPQKAI